MIDQIVPLFLALFVSDADAEGLRKTAPEDLTLEQAREHTRWARVAGAVHGIDGDLLLATAYRESHYTQSVTFREKSGSLSCGVVQSTGKDRADCDRLNGSLLAGYMGGAAALRRNIDFCNGDVHCALSWYAGGGTFVKNCRERPQEFKRQCAIPGNRIRRARRIKEERLRASRS